MAACRFAAALAIVAVTAGDWGSASTEAASTSGFRWDAPIGCPDGDAVQTRLRALMGDADVALHGVDVDGRLTLTDAGYALQLAIGIDDRIESRRLESEDCVLLSHAAALLVAITVDAVAAAEAIADDALVVEDSTLPPPVENDDMTPDERAPAPDATRPETVSARDDGWQHGIEGTAAGGLGVALVPGVTGGLEGLIGWRFGPLRVRALGYHWFARPAELDPSAGARVALSGGGLRACYAVVMPRIEVPLCTGPDVAALHGAGIGEAVRSRSYADVWAALAVGVGAEVPVSSRVSLVGRAEVLVGLRRPALHLDGPDRPIEVFRAHPIGFRLVLGASVHSR